MLSMYRGTILITITGIIKKPLRKEKQISCKIIPDMSLNIKAESLEECEQSLANIAEYYINDWKKQLAEHLEKGNGLVLTGYNPEKENIPFFWTPCFKEFQDISYKIINCKKVYDFKNETVEHCMKHLTPEEFKKEFGFLIKTP